MKSIGIVILGVIALSIGTSCSPIASASKEAARAEEAALAAKASAEAAKASAEASNSARALAEAASVLSLQAKNDATTVASIAVAAVIVGALMLMVPYFGAIKRTFVRVAAGRKPSAAAPQAEHKASHPEPKAEEIEIPEVEIERAA